MKKALFPVCVFLILAFCCARITTKGLLYTSSNFAIYQDSVVQGAYRAVILSDSSIISDYRSGNSGLVKTTELKDDVNDSISEVIRSMNKHHQQSLSISWTKSMNLASLPHFTSDICLAGAMFNLSLEEMLKDIRPDSTFMAGAKWNGVWTRDVSYSVCLALATLCPDIAMKSLRLKVKNKRIIQDTGSGGSWPVSSDRSVWALAAWEIYKVTGDMNWLAESFEIIKNSEDDDLQVIYCNQTGLMRGESSFLDWREQTYPKWMEPIDIYSSQNLSTNVIHYQTFRIISEMASLLHHSDEGYSKRAVLLKGAINKWLWMPDHGYYGQYLYGNYQPILSPRSDALGEALTILYDIPSSERQKQVMSNTPITEYGITCIFPQIPDIPPYHNDAIWPFVQAFWAMAAAKTENEKAVALCISSIYRQTALFLTNKENSVAENGDYKGTAINSDRQLWSVAGNLALVFKIYFGMDYTPEGLWFKPYIPKSYAGVKKLSGFTYRKTRLNVSVTGYGNGIHSFLVDGKKLERPFIPADLTGNHNIDIILNNTLPVQSTVNLKTVDYSPATVSYQNNGSSVNLDNVGKIDHFLVFKNGKRSEKRENNLNIDEERVAANYFFAAVDSLGYNSFASKPYLVIPPTALIEVEAETFGSRSDLVCDGYSGKGFVELSKEKNINYTFSVTIPEDGEFAIDFRYANGSGPVNTDNKCAIRTLKEGNEQLGAVVMPQRGKDDWSNWGLSNPLLVKLNQGQHTFTLSFEPCNENMNGEVNTAMLDMIRFIRFK